MDKKYKKLLKINNRPFIICDKNSAKFRELTEVLNLSNDDFIRTTEKRHIDGAKSLWNKLKDNGDIYLDTYKGWYSVSDETFYNEKDLIKQKDDSFKTVTGGPVDWIEEESYFFKLSKYTKKLLELYEEKPDFILPKSRRNEVISFVKSGLRDLSVSRNTFNWGISVPDDKKHVMYVWLDALSSYPNSLGYIEDKKSKLSPYWLNSTHIIGKDILRHHAVYWPAFLMSAQLDLPKRIFAHGWWTNEGNKISKFGNCGSSHWDTWSKTPGNVHNSDDGSVACDHYNRFKEDLDLIKSGGFDSYRFSTSWARVMPDGKNINTDGLDFYDRLVDGMVERGLKPNLT